MDATYREIAHKLRGAYRVLFITGAGVSADSGLPTYRGVGGLYNDGETEEGLSIEDALSGECFAVRPDITWKYLAQIQRNCRSVQPNAAHLAIAGLERSLEVVILTQNVDGLHLRAGSSNVIEIHGSLDERYCPHCATPADADSRETPPRCAQCGKIVRPQVVLFGEALPDKATERLYEVLDQGFDMVFVIGTSAVFPYVVEPVVQALRQGVTTVEINPTRTRLSDHVRYYIPRGAAEAMTAICERMIDDLP